jgi:hypothetical protein
MGDAVVVLKEAETVTMTAAHEDFILIRTRGGLTGWVARANLGIIVPALSATPPRSKKLPGIG